jgi:hypothetical protein
VRKDKAILPGAEPPGGLPVFADDGAILPPPGHAAKADRHEQQRRSRKQDRRSRP